GRNRKRSKEFRPKKWTKRNARHDARPLPTSVTYLCHSGGRDVRLGTIVGSANRLRIGSCSRPAMAIRRTGAIRLPGSVGNIAQEPPRTVAQSKSRETVAQSVFMRLLVII